MGLNAHNKGVKDFKELVTQEGKAVVDMSSPTLETELSWDVKERLIKEAAKEVAADNSKELNLEKDPVREHGQNYALVSFLSEESRQRISVKKGGAAVLGTIAMKIKGVYETVEEAREKAQFLMKVDPTFDIFVLEMNCWCAVPPDPEMMKDQVYYEETLHNMITEHKLAQAEAKQFFLERKNRLIDSAPQPEPTTSGSLADQLEGLPLSEPQSRPKTGNLMPSEMLKSMEKPILPVELGV